MTQPMIPMADLGAQWPGLADEIEAGFRRVAASGCYVQGPEVAAFEREVADWLGVPHAVGCGSGTDALALSLRACGIGPGDEVITTPFTFFGTVEAIMHAGAVPVFADIDRASFNLDPGRVAAAVTARTRAILPVHLFGLPADTGALRAIALRHRLRLIEDCAQAFGAQCGGAHVGSFGDAAGFSFYPSKNLGAFGDAGLVTTRRPEVADAVRALGNHGSRERYLHDSIGGTSRLDELQAVVLRAKLRRMEHWNAARRRIAAHYDDALSGLPGLQPPRVPPGVLPAWQQYTVLLDDREPVIAALRAAGIASAVHYPRPLHRQPALRARHGSDRLPVADDIAARCLSLPMHPALSDSEIERIGAVIGDAARQRSARVAAATGRQQRLAAQPR